MNKIKERKKERKKSILAFFTHYNYNNSLSADKQINILPILSKVYERLIYNQIHPYFDERFLKLQCVFGKSFDNQHFLINLKEKMANVR